MLKSLTTLLLFVALSSQAKLSEDERKERAEQAAAKKLKMESCLTEVRSFYFAEEQRVKAFTEAHPTQDKGRLTSKILA
jgi:hypothetical protein